MKRTKIREEMREFTVSDRFNRGPCNKFRPEAEANCRLIFSRLFSVSSTLCKNIKIQRPIQGSEGTPISAIEQKTQVITVQN